jgi:hypothetical protein
MLRTAPGLVAILVTLLAATPAADARTCKHKKACKAQVHKKPKHETGWHNGIYNGGPGDPVIAPLPSLPG